MGSDRRKLDRSHFSCLRLHLWVDRRRTTHAGPPNMELMSAFAQIPRQTALLSGEKSVPRSMTLVAKSCPSPQLDPFHRTAEV